MDIFIQISLCEYQNLFAIRLYILSEQLISILKWYQMTGSSHSWNPTFYVQLVCNEVLKWWRLLTEFSVRKVPEFGGGNADINVMPPRVRIWHPIQPPHIASIPLIPLFIQLQKITSSPLSPQTPVSFFFFEKKMTTFIGFLSSPLSPTINHTVPYILTNWTLSYLVLASRHWKKYYGFDHNESPRYDIQEYGERMVKEGKLTKRQLDRIKRVQSASSNSIEHFAFFLGCIVSFLWLLACWLGGRRGRGEVARWWIAGIFPWGKG